MKNRILLFVLALCSTVAMNAQIATISCMVDAASPTYNRALDVLADPTCNAGAATTTSGVGSAVSYALHQFSPTVTGTYNFEAILGTLGDSHFSLYCSFDPASPLANLVAVNDDGGVGLASLITAPLTAGMCYTLVTTAFGNGSFGTFDVDVTGPAGATLDGAACDIDGGVQLCVSTISSGPAPDPCPSGVTVVNADFTADFDMANWATTTVGDGSVNTNPPTDVTLTSADDGTAGDATFCITVTDETMITFDWDYSSTDACSSTFDPAGYSVNGIQTQVSTDGAIAPAIQSGSESVMLNAGDTFCFYQNTSDGILGSGTSTFSNFTFTACAGIVLVPTMTQWGLFLFGLVMMNLGLVFVYNKQRQAAM